MRDSGRCGLLILLEVVAVVLAGRDTIQDLSDEGLDTSPAYETSGGGVAKDALDDVVVEGAIRLTRSRLPRALLGGGTVAGGTPGHDFPVLNSVPVTVFNCRDRQHGYYADVDTACQVFHVCHADGRMDSFLCPNGTIFQQQQLVCDWWYNVDCQTSSQHFGVNLEIGKVSTTSPHASPASGSDGSRGSSFGGVARQTAVTSSSAGVHSGVTGRSGFLGSQGSSGGAFSATRVPEAAFTPSGGSGTSVNHVEATVRATAAQSSASGRSPFSSFQTPTNAPTPTPAPTRAPSSTRAPPPRTQTALRAPSFTRIPTPPRAPTPSRAPKFTITSPTGAPTPPRTPTPPRALTPSRAPTFTRNPTPISAPAPPRASTPQGTLTPSRASVTSRGPTRVAVSRRPLPPPTARFDAPLQSPSRPPPDGVNLLISGIQSTQIPDNVADARDTGFGVPLPSLGGNQAPQNVVQSTQRFQTSQGVSLSNTRPQTAAPSHKSQDDSRRSHNFGIGQPAVPITKPAVPITKPATTATSSRGSATFGRRSQQTSGVGQPVGVPLPLLSNIASSSGSHQGSSASRASQSHQGSSASRASQSHQGSSASRASQSHQGSSASRASQSHQGSSASRASQSGSTHLGAPQRIPGAVGTSSQQGTTQSGFGIPLPSLSSAGGFQGSFGVPLPASVGTSSGRFGATTTTTGGTRRPSLGTGGAIIIVEDDRDDRFDLDDRFDDDRFDLDDRFDDDRFDLDDRFDDDRFDDDRFDDDRFDDDRFDNDSRDLDDRFDDDRFDLDDRFDDDRFDDDRFDRANFLRTSSNQGKVVLLPPSEIQLPPPTTRF
nr:flocculation protein FLO11-like [Procambarus clarkii]